MSQRWLYEQFRWNVGHLQKRTETLNRMGSSRFAQAMEKLDGSSKVSRGYSQQALPDSSTHTRSGKKRRQKFVDSEEESTTRTHRHKKSKKKKKRHHTNDDGEYSGDSVTSKTARSKKSTNTIRSENYSDSNSDSDLDLEKDIHPIHYYIKDRAEMIHEMFRTLRGRKLKAMLPEVVRDMSLKSVRDLCLTELEVMSKKRIRRLLAGDENDAISSSGTEESSDKEDTKKCPSHAPELGESVVDSTSKSHVIVVISASGLLFFISVHLLCPGR